MRLVQVRGQSGADVEQGSGGPILDEGIEIILCGGGKPLPV